VPTNKIKNIFQGKVLAHDERETLIIFKC
jgi:hypothetical protein